MSGKALRCDARDCEAMFPKTPVKGRDWKIREESHKAGWRSDHDWQHNPEYDPLRTGKDYCPKHASDLVVLASIRDVQGRIRSFTEDLLLQGSIRGDLLAMARSRGIDEARIREALK